MSENEKNVYFKMFFTRKNDKHFYFQIVFTNENEKKTDLLCFSQAKTRKSLKIFNKSIKIYRKSRKI